MDENIIGYYAVIPARVRYNKELKFAERLLYSEITALLGKKGYCFAKNKYFADLYNVTTETISRWISHLKQLRLYRNRDHQKREKRNNRKKNIYSRRYLLFK